jgi:hypothetical protein
MTLDQKKAVLFAYMQHLLQLNNNQAQKNVYKRLFNAAKEEVDRLNSIQGDKE